MQSVRSSSELARGRRALSIGLLLASVLCVAVPPAATAGATGTILFSPGSANPVGAAAPANGCMSSVLGRQVPENACVQRPADGLWFRCDHGGWASSSSSDEACGEKYPR